MAIRFGILALLFFAQTGCMKAYIQSVGGEVNRDFSRIFKTDINTAWQSCLEALQSVPLESANRESGMIRTRWRDNTADKNFADSHDSAPIYMKAQYRFHVTLAEGYYSGVESVKVTILKEQMVQKDVLDGLRPQPTDSIDENTLLYRIERLIDIRRQLAEIENRKAEEALKSFE